MKGVVPAAGKGERLEPLTLAMPKELIRVGNKPVIEHVIDNLKACDVKDIMIITGWKKGAVLDYLGSGSRLGVNTYYRVQEEQKGIAHAVAFARDWIGNEDFALIYGDNYFKPAENISKAADFHREKGAYATLVLHPVEDPTRFGIVKLDEDGRVMGMIEKPTVEEAEPYKTNGVYYNIAGLIILKPKIFEYIEKTPPGKNNEIQMTDAIELMRKDDHPVYGFVFEGLRYDIGTFESIKMADRQEMSDTK